METAGSFGILACVSVSCHLLQGGSNHLLTSSTWCANPVCSGVYMCMHACAVAADTSWTLTCYCKLSISHSGDWFSAPCFLRFLQSNSVFASTGTGQQTQFLNEEFLLLEPQADDKLFRGIGEQLLRDLTTF